MLRFYLHAIIIAFILCLIFGPTTYGSCDRSDLQNNRSLHHTSGSQNWLNSDHQIYLIQNHQRAQYKEMIKETHEKRFEIFYEKKKWDIPLSSQSIQKRLDIDQYDIPEAIYLVYYDRNHGVVGGLRMLPTTSTYMLKNSFSHLVDNKPEHMPVSDKIWEATRLFFCKPKEINEPKGFARQGTLELLIAMQEFGLTWNLKEIIAVTDPHVETIFHNMDWHYTRIAEPKNMQGEPVVVLNLTVSEENLKRIREKANIHTPVLYATLPLSTTWPKGFSQLKLGSKKSRDLTRAAL